MCKPANLTRLFEMPFTAYIVDCVRTPGGKKNGSLREWHPADLGAVVIDALLSRTGIDGAEVDDVIFGCVSQVGSQSSNVARNVVLSSRLPESVPATTVDRQCGSSQQALHFAAQAVMSGVQDVVIAGGVEVMSAVPIGANVADGYAQGHGLPWSSTGIREQYGKVMFSQFEGAELLAEKFQLTRAELDDFGAERCGDIYVCLFCRFLDCHGRNSLGAVGGCSIDVWFAWFAWFAFLRLPFERPCSGHASHRRALAATKAGRFANELIPCAGKSKAGEDVTLSTDEGIRPGTTTAKLAKLKTLRKGRPGVLTAGTASQITDGASAILICNEAGLRKLGVTPRAKIVCQTVVGSDPVMMLYGPIPVRLLSRASGGGLRLGALSVTCAQGNPSRE